MKERQSLKIWYHGISDIGLVRTENQDSLGKFPGDNSDIYQPKGVLFIVADGMGGHSGGKEASQSAVEHVSKEYFSSNTEIITTALLHAFKTANLKIHQSSKDAPQFQKKGTTCSALVIENGMAHIAHVGDSRIYKIAGGKIKQLTNDHTEVGEMYRKGILSEEEVKNHPSKSVLVRAMGIEADIEVDLIDNSPVDEDDIFILCSDGLANVSAEEIFRTATENEPEAACNILIAMANEKGGRDNITVQVVKITSDQPKEMTAGINPHKNNKLINWFIFLIVIVIVIGIFLIFYKSDIQKIIQDNSDPVTNSNLNNDNLPAADPLEGTINKANNYLAAGNLDSAMAVYTMVLVRNPLHMGALKGKELIRLLYIQEGDKFNRAMQKEDALAVYLKAQKLSDQDPELANKIKLLRNDLKQVSVSKDNMVREGSKEPKNEPTIRAGGSDEKMVTGEEPVAVTTDISEWYHDDLMADDFELDNNRFTFFGNAKSKKLIYKHQVEDVDIETDLQFHENSKLQKAGIIIGYSFSEKTGIENYYLLTVDNLGNFNLIKRQEQRDELLLTVKPAASSDKMRVRLKLKSLGPWIMLYSDNKLLDSYLDNDFIKGRIGLYSESSTRVDFIGLKISSAFEK